jgi:4-diphosphocytidyl-2C-methyl-D-erythritol kinase
MGGIMADKKTLMSMLDNLLLQDQINIKEYQDKYFFIKEIEEHFPSFGEEVLYKALENTNNYYHKPVKKRLFIDKFTAEIYKMMA